MRAEAPRPVRLANYRPFDYLVETVDLDVRLAPEATQVTAELRLRANPAGTAGAPLVLDGEDIELVSLALDGAPLDMNAYERGDRNLVLKHPPAEPFRLTIGTRINPAANTQLMGLYLTRGVYCTQCEAEGFRRITFFPDRPDVLAVYRTRIEARRPDAPVLLANGNLVESGEVSGAEGRHYAVWHDPFPKPCYLFALVAGDLAHIEDRFVTASGRDVRLRIYVEPGKQDRCGYAMDALKRAMRWDEKVFGREYDLDIFMIVAVSDFNMGAMENKGLNIFNDKYILARPDTATDADYAGIETVVAHEYFHNWTGNRITCRDWFQLCLKEGLTVFRDQEFTSDMRSRPVKRISDVRLLRAQQFAEDAGPLAHPVRPDTYSEINNFYTATVYEKGAEVIRMLRTLLGPQGFRAGMDLYFARHDGRAATVEDFLACFADATGRDLGQFKLWYSQAGTPEVAASGSYDAAARSYTLTLAQAVPPTPGQPVKAPMTIPIAMGLIGPDGLDVALDAPGAPLAGGVLTLSTPSLAVTFRNVPAPPVPSLLRGFSAPVKLAGPLADAALAFRMRHDADPFNRWQAGQSAALRLLTRDAPEAEREAFADALGAVVRDARLEPAFVAQALQLPSEADVAQELGRDVDPDAIHRAREALRTDIGRRIGPILRDAYDAHAADAPYAPDAASAGRRALRAAALDLLAATRDERAIALAEAHYDHADNMTDRMAALAILVRLGAADQALAAFYARFADDALVVDKWFALQATAPGRGTLDRVRALTGHPAFSFANPNRVRALIGSFAAANHTEFNRPDGAGYGFVAGVVSDLDTRNPQVAARLLSAFKSWRALEPVRRAAAEAALRSVAAEPALSPDVADIVARCLQ